MLPYACNFISIGCDFTRWGIDGDGNRVSPPIRQFGGIVYFVTPWPNGGGQTFGSVGQTFCFDLSCRRLLSSQHCCFDTNGDSCSVRCYTKADICGLSISRFPMRFEARRQARRSIKRSLYSPPSFHTISFPRQFRCRPIYFQSYLSVSPSVQSLWLLLQLLIFKYSPSPFSPIFLLNLLIPQVHLPRSLSLPFQRIV